MLIHRHLAHLGCDSFRKGPRPSLSSLVTWILSCEKSTTVISQAAESFAREARPPSVLNGSSPGSAPGCQPFSCSNSLKSSMLLNVFARVTRRRIGERGDRGEMGNSVSGLVAEREAVVA